MIAQVNEAGEYRIVGHDDPVADRAIVGDMAVNHKKPIITDHGGVAFGAAMHGTEFAEGVSIAYDSTTLVNRIDSNILGLIADATVTGEGISMPDTTARPDVGTVTDIIAVPDNSAIVDDYKRPYHTIIADSGFCRNNATRVYG
ncbi:MAG: hypothetical protein DHS20C01_10580 [marine bacterium B5-7]|nr:MAG: hypothetical protein DHS20C01_10580 [marine bacterium B5-7]